MYKKGAYHSWNQTEDIGGEVWNLNIHTLDKKIILAGDPEQIWDMYGFTLDPFLFSDE